ncbi:MAG TPA: hypothetical protein VE091_10275 [Gemmatimonadales bacterium]|nr:hypothetical protein [Gemmatimonadales bacterium]
MPDRKDGAYLLTVLSPIMGGQTQGVAHAAAIRATLCDLGKRKDTPLARIPMLHLARWVVIDDVRSQGSPAREEHLRSKYLLFTADFDGDEPTGFLESLLEAVPDLAHSLWKHCVGFPGVKDRDAFCRYIERCRIETGLPVAAYGTYTLPEVLRALDVQRRMLAFIKSNQGKPAADLRPAFEAFLQELAAAPQPTPVFI